MRRRRSDDRAGSGAAAWPGHQARGEAGGPSLNTPRAAPLLWLSVWKDELTKQRNDFEDACLRRLTELMPLGRRVTILADRGFGDQKLFAFLATPGFG